MSMKAAPAVIALLISVGAQAQWLNYPDPGIPRLPDGKPNLNAPTPRLNGRPDLSGVWSGPGAGSYDRNIARDLKPGDVQPWAEKIYQQRVLAMGLDAPRANCLPDPFLYYHIVDLARIVQTPGLMVILYQGTTNSVHRTVFTDSRPLPKDANPSWMGYSVGHWDGDTMVVDTAGFNDRGWLDIEGHPHTEALHITERFRRRDFGHMTLEVTIDDPKTFTRPFSMKIEKTLVPDTDLLESICESDHSVPHMVGGEGIMTLAPAALSKYTGTYEYAGGRPALITMEGDILQLQEGTNPLKLPLAAHTDTVFVSRTNGDLIEFKKDARGAITEFTFHNQRAVRKQ